MEKDKWIESILNSTDGITKIAPNTILYSKIQNKIKDRNSDKNYSKWLVAASITILITLNIGFFSNKIKKSNSVNFSELIVTTDNQLY